MTNAEAPTESRATSHESGPISPPIRAGALGVIERPSVWPMVLGVISIVFGLGAALIYGICSPVMTLLMPLLADSFQGVPGAEMSAAQMEAMNDMKWPILGMNLLLGLVGAALLVAGIGMVRRRWWCMRWAVGWAIVKIIITIPNGLLGRHINKTQFEAMQEGAANTTGAPPPPAAMFTAMDYLSEIGIIISVIWSLALPIFFLVWFCRSKIRSEIAAWHGSGTTAQAA